MSGHIDLTNHGLIDSRTTICIPITYLVSYEESSRIVYYCYYKKINCYIWICGLSPCKPDALPTELTAQN